MRVLYLEHPMHTNGSWSLYEGLVRVLSRADVVDFPWKGTFHGERHSLMDHAWYRDVYAAIARGEPLPDGIPPLAPGESLTTGDQREIVRDREAYFTSYARRREPERVEDEIVEMINYGRFDLAVLSNTHRVPTIAWARLRDRVRAGRLPPLAFYDPGERDELNAWWWHAFRPALTFKMCLTPAEWLRYPCAGAPCRVYPLPLSSEFVLGGLPVFRDMATFGEPRPVDVLCHLGATHPDRAAVSARAARVVAERGYSTVAGVGSPHRYFRDAGTGIPYFALVAASRAQVNHRGSARDATRYWQTVALGAALVADGTMGCVHPWPFLDREHGWFYRDEDELERALVEALSDEARRDAVARAARAHAVRYHSIEARALFFLGVVRERLGIDDPRCAEWADRLGWSCRLPEWQTGPVVGYGQEDWRGRLTYAD